MKKRWIAIALLTVLLMGIGGAIGKVGVRQESDGSAYSLYFVERDLRSADGGDALRSEERTLEDSGLSTEELAAALVANGVSEVSNVHYIERGYEDVIGKLRGIGAKIDCVECEESVETRQIG